jgi:regulator of RNase E activity RraA
MMDDFAARLRRLDSCAVSDALDKLDLTGAVAGIHRCSTDRRVAGRIVTVKLKEEDGRLRSRHLGAAAVEAARSGDVIVIEQSTGIDAAAWGGNLSLGARLRGVAGVIVDGPVRDVDQARLYDFPIFARGLTSRTARGRLAEAGTNVPIRVGDIVVSPGDFVVADASGVVFVPASEIVRVVEAAEAIARSEQALVDSLLDGAPIGEVMGRRYETMLKR